MLIKCDFQLPFKLPIKDGIAIVSAYRYGDFKSTFNTTKKIVKEQDWPELEMYYTVMQIEFSPNIPFPEGTEIQQHLYLTVLSCIDYINNYLDALRSELEISYVHNITIADLPSVLLIDVEGENYLYLTTHPALMYPASPVDSAVLVKVGATMEMWDKYPAIAIQERFFETAKSYLFREDFVRAIIELQTSFEVFIRNTHRLILLSKKVSESEINDLTRTPFKNVIEHHLSKHLNTKLSFTEEGPIKEWNEKLYLLRNAIVHQGKYQVTKVEADEAFEAYISARNHIADCMNKEGLLSEHGKIDLTIFPTEVKDIDRDKLVQSLKEKGFLPTESDVKVLS